MKVNVLFFGATADEVGRREMGIVLDEKTTAAQALSKVVAEFPLLNNHKLLYSVNLSYVGGEKVLNDGDEFAIFTAVSGG